MSVTHDSHSALRAVMTSHHNRRSILGAAAALGGATLLSFPASGVAAQDGGSALSFGVNYDTSLFDHLRSSTTPFALPLVFENLVIRADDGSWAPYIAESWEEAADGLSITFKIRPGVLFHDGTPLDAAAVKWFFDTARDTLPVPCWSSLLSAHFAGNRPGASSQRDPV